MARIALPDTAKTPCLITDCGRPARCKGYCAMHYARLKRHGTIVKTSNKGEPLPWIKRHASYSGNDCLPWPFRRDSQGRGVISIDGRHRVASNIMCQEAWGPAPADKPHAAHSCGNGHLACTNPNHLRWASPVENKADSVEHGTVAKGMRNGKAILTDDIVRRIRCLSSERMSERAIAKEIGVSRGAVQSVLSGRCWSSVQ